MDIRLEREADFDEIHDVVAAAFGDEKVAPLVRRIREVGGYVRALSLVAVERDEIVGHIMLSHVDLSGHPVLQLSPLAVRPDRQNLGIGDRLSREAIRLADDAGEPLILVLGHPTYYPRFGFSSARAAGIEPPNPEITDGPWMVKRLTNYDPSLVGTVDFGPAFSEP